MLDGPKSSTAAEVAQRDSAYGVDPAPRLLAFIDEEIPRLSTLPKVNTIMRILSTVSVLVALLVAMPMQNSTAANPAAESIVYRFGSDGYPEAALITDATGSLYGTTYMGTVFRLTLTGGNGNRFSYTLLHRFGPHPDGGEPIAALVEDKAGALYSTTYFGGTGWSGTVFKLTPKIKGGYTESIIYNFQNGSDGAYPTTGLIADGSGALYGTINRIVYKLTPKGGRYNFRIIYTFPGGDAGDGPAGALIADSSGALYGIAGGGSAGQGVAYKLTLTHGSYNETVLYTFQGNDGNPNGTLLMDSAGALYGISTFGGANGEGDVFKLIPTKNGYIENFHYDFGQNRPDGTEPVGGLVEDAAGALYGTTHAGVDQNHQGTVFKLSPSGNSYTESVLYSFQGKPDGGYPWSYASPVIGAKGALYGTTYNGGWGRFAGQGTVFEVARQ